MATRKKIPLIPEDASLAIAAAKDISHSHNFIHSGADIFIVGSGTAVLTFPTTTDTIAALAATQIFSNKSISDTLLVDTVDEYTTDVGVTVDTVLIKDGLVDGLDCSGVAAGAEVNNISDINVTDLTDAGATTLHYHNALAPDVHTPSAAATATLNLDESFIHDIIMPAGNITIAVSNETNGDIFTVKILQDGTGSRTVTWFSTIKWENGTTSTLTTTADKADTFVFRCTGTDTYDGFTVGLNT